MTQSPALKLENVGVTYANGHIALEDISVELNAGHIYGLVGVNGAGKSTLFKSIMGFIKPSSGTINVSGENIRSALRKNMISYVPQTEDVDWNFPVLVEDVVMMGRYGHMGFLRHAKIEDKNAVNAALERVGMSTYRKRQIGELSGGQKKRVFVARALAQGSKIILLDEPFTGVDIKTEDSLISLFQALSKEGHLILVSTHDLGSVPHFCDEVILINRHLVANGPVETTFTHENLAETFGGMLRHHRLSGDDLHDDTDPRGLTVLSDDERPLVFYGEKGGEIILTPPKDKSK